MSTDQGRARLDPYCVIAKWERNRLHTDNVPESVMKTAIKLGWAVIARDSDFTEPEIEPDQSNPKRTED